MHLLHPGFGIGCPDIAAVRQRYFSLREAEAALLPVSWSFDVFLANIVRDAELVYRTDAEMAVCWSSAHFSSGVFQLAARILSDRNVIVTFRSHASP